MKRTVVILTGPLGCGKTTQARLIVSEDCVIDEEVIKILPSSEIQRLTKEPRIVICSSRKIPYDRRMRQLIHGAQVLRWEITCKSRKPFSPFEGQPTSKRQIQPPRLSPRMVPPAQSLKPKA